MKHIWITRASPGAEATAARVAALGHEGLIAPVLKVVALGGAVDLSDVGAVAFTSANGVRAFADRCPERDLRVFAVGAATALASKAAGFRDILAAAGGVSDLAAMIRSLAEQVPGVVLHPSTTEPAGDLVGDLDRLGVTARALPLYQTVAMDVPRAVLDRIPSLDGVLVHSPKAGRRLAQLLSHAELPNLKAYCLSPQVAATLAALRIGPIGVAPLPNEEALLSLL